MHVGDTDCSSVSASIHTIALQADKEEMQPGWSVRNCCSSHLCHTLRWYPLRFTAWHVQFTCSLEALPVLNSSVVTQSIWQRWHALWWLSLEIVVKCLLHFFPPFHTFLLNPRYPTPTSQQSDEPHLHHKCSGIERKDIFFFVRREGWWWVLDLIFASTYKCSWFPGLFVSMKLKELLMLS